MRLCGLCRTGIIRVLTCRGRHQSRRNEGFGQVKEACACWPLFDAVPDYSFNESGQLQPRAVFVSKPKLLIPHLSAHVYLM
jgi:hypothetical protein